MSRVGLTGERRGATRGRARTRASAPHRRGLVLGNNQLIVHALHALDLLGQLPGLVALLFGSHFAGQGDRAILHGNLDGARPNIGIARQVQVDLVEDGVVAQGFVAFLIGGENGRQNERKQKQDGKESHDSHSLGSESNSLPPMERQSMALRNSSLSRHSGVTFTNNSRKTFLPSIVSISVRAALPIFFMVAPLAPIRIAFWPGRSTKIVAAMRVSFGVSCHWSTRTATECGTSWRVSSRIFSRIISDARNRSGWSVR